MRRCQTSRARHLRRFARWLIEGIMGFRQHQKLNLIRHAEENKDPLWINDIEGVSASIETELGGQQTSFKQKALARGAQLSAVTGIGEAYRKHSAKNLRIILLLYALLAGLGFFSVLQTINNAGSQVNVYWLLLVLIGVNFVSILVWGLLAVRNNTHRSPLLNVYQYLLKRFSSSQPNALFSTWSETHLFGSTGKWFLSKHIHAYWLMYLAGGLLALLVILSGKQIDFVWGTTILEPQTFATLTSLLGSIPAKFGFQVPDQSMVFNSLIGASPDVLAASRKTWASFVIGAVVFYAVFPRLVLWIIAAVALRVAERNYQPDWEQPYYYALRTKLSPEGSSLGVIDPDDTPVKSSPAAAPSANESLLNLDDLQLPDDAYLAAFEWGDKAPPAAPVQNPVLLDAINDVHAQTGLLQALKQSPRPTVVMVQLHRAADRGASRFLAEIMQYAPLHLVVTRTHKANSDSARWASWQAVAERIELRSQQLYLVEL